MTGALGATLSGLNAGCAIGGGTAVCGLVAADGCCPAAGAAVWAKAHAPAKSEVRIIRTIMKKTFPQLREQKFWGRDGILAQGAVDFGKQVWTTKCCKAIT